MSNEFEDREGPQQLGELTDDILKERGESREWEQDPDINTGTGRPTEIPGETPIGTPRRAGLPPDIVTENRIRQVPGEAGSKRLRADVTAVYDSRLVNGRDFLHTQTDTETVDAYGAGTMVLSASFQVADGFVGVLRGFFFEFLTPIANIEHNDTSTTIKINGAAVPNYSELELGQASQKFVPIFAIGPNSAIFSIDVSIAHAIPFAVSLSTVSCYFQLYGNELLARGLPPQFEIANLVES